MRLKPFLILMLLGQTLHAQKPVILSDFTEQVSLSDAQMNYLDDPSCAVSPSLLFSGLMDDEFRQVDFANPDPALLNDKPGGCIWFRFIMVNASSRQFAFHLQPGILSDFGEYRLYQRFSSGLTTVRKSGNSIAPSMKDVNISGSDDMRIFLAPNETDTLFLRVSLTGTSPVSDLTFTVSTQENVIKKDRTKRIVFGLFVGIMLIMVLYNIPLFVERRENS